MRLIVFVEGPDEAALRAFARTLDVPWRLLARPEQGLFLLEVTDRAGEAERAAASLQGVRSWAFGVVDEGTGS